MKLATYLRGGVSRLGIVDTGRASIVDAAAAARAVTGGDDARFLSMDALVQSGSGGLAALRDITRDPQVLRSHGSPLAETTLLAPLPVPAQIRDCSVFERHIRDGGTGLARMKARMEGRDPPPMPDAGSAIPEIYRAQPIYYISNRFSVCGPDATVVWPRYSKAMDFELEIAAVIGTGGRDIDASQAADHIFGYTIFNDFSARDQQAIEMAGLLGPTKGKSFDAGNAFGPWIVTPDELGPVADLTVAVRVNGRELIRTDMRGMLHSFEAMIAFISQDETLHPGEIIGSGTVGGCCGLELDRLLSDGDTIELDVSGIGALRNVVRAHG